MPRKADGTWKTEQATFPTRLNELMQERGISQEKLARALGVKRQTVSLYKTGQSSPNAEQLKKIAEFFNVSSDWLLGISNVKSQDTDLHSVCEYTGLSEAAMLVIRFIHLRGETTTEKLLSMLLESEDFTAVLDKFTAACNLEIDCDLGIDENGVDKIKEFNENYKQELKRIGAVVYGAGPTSDMFLYNASNDFMMCMKQIRIKWKEAYNNG